MAKLNKQETDAKDTLEGLVQERQKLYVSQSEKGE